MLLLRWCDDSASFVAPAQSPDVLYAGEAGGHQQRTPEGGDFRPIADVCSEDVKMPQRVKAADRVKHADERSDLWVKTPYWGKEVEDAFQDRCASGDLPDAWSILFRFFEEGFSIALRRFEDSVCVTLTDGDRRGRSVPCLLSGWGADPHDALLVVDYKHRVLLDCDWDSCQSESGRPPRR